MTITTEGFRSIIECLEARTPTDLTEITKQWLQEMPESGHILSLWQCHRADSEVEITSEDILTALAYQSIKQIVEKKNRPPDLWKEVEIDPVIQDNEDCWITDIKSYEMWVLEPNTLRVVGGEKAYECKVPIHFDHVGDLADEKILIEMSQRLVEFLLTD